MILFRLDNPASYISQFWIKRGPWLVRWGSLLLLFTELMNWVYYPLPTKAIGEFLHNSLVSSEITPQ